MNSYLEIALINAAMIIPLALLAELAGRAFRRPALTHLLWVLILVKLVTPPIVQIPLLDREWLAATGRQLLPPVLADVDRNEINSRLTNSRLTRIQDEPSNSPKSRPRPRSLAETNRRSNVRQPSLPAAVVKWLGSEQFRNLLTMVLQMVWSFGALIWFSVQGFRCIRFRLSLAKGCAAPLELQQFSDQLAVRLGLARSPTVWLMPGVMSPMLWGTGESTLLIFPEELLDRLDPEATGTLLTHELAHYRRRDHWVRIIALMATGFFWWHPVVWWARREIEAVEEECCDALVVKAAAAPPKRYAEAILEAVDFLAEFQLRLPPLATGLGQVPFLRQRLTWIMRGPRPQNLGYSGRVLCLLLVCTLPIQPTWLAATAPAPVRLQIPTMIPTPVESVPSQPTFPSNNNSDTNVTGELAAISPPPQEVQRDPSRWSGFEIRAQSNDDRFFVLGNKAALFLLDIKTGRDFDLGSLAVSSMSFCASFDRFVTIGRDQTLRLWNADTCEVLQSWQIPGGPSKSVDISADGRQIVTAGRDGIVRIWNQENSQPVRELPREVAPVNCVRFSASGELLAVATGDWMGSQSGRIALFNAGDWSERISMNWNSPTAAVAFRADGESLTSGDWQGRIARWSISSGELLGLANGHKDLMAAAEFSPNVSSLAEIEIPDLAPEPAWEEPEPSNQIPFFLNPWNSQEKAGRSRVQDGKASMNSPSSAKNDSLPMPPTSR